MRDFILRGCAGLILLLATAILPGAATAQDQVWVQIESHPDLGTAEARVRAYSRLVDNVNGFRATTGLYAIALGPFSVEEGQRALAELLGQGLIPRDSFLEGGSLYASRFFPVGTSTLTDGATAPEIATETLPPVGEIDPEPLEIPAIAAPPEPVALPEETVQEARTSESLLTREQRDELQIALQYFGYYTSIIDGDFGPGTRGAMQRWQSDKGYEPTGILTTRQRAELLGDVERELAVLGMETVTDERAGIQIDLPLSMVAFDSYNFPFAQYDSVNDSGVRVLLISQPGDRSTLFGLYEIMQTLEIVPLEGERQRGSDSFVLTGQSATLRSHTEARIVGGAVKGFTLIWPPEQDEEMERALPLMQSSFAALDGTLDPAAIPEGLGEDIDMVSGLEVRSPDMVRSGFYLDARGTVLTTTEVLGQCEQILIDNAYEARIAFRDDALGVAVLSPVQQLAPFGFAQFAPEPARLRAEIAVAGFPFDGALSAASTSFGTLADLRGVNGEDGIQRLDVVTEDSEAGSPVLDLSGSVIGMVLPGTASGRALPDEVTLALRGDQLASVLQSAGIGVSIAQGSGALNRENLSREGSDIAVRVSCWN